MKRPTVDELLQQGIHGPLQTKPEERKKYLGTLRERIIAVLKKNQVAEEEVYPQIENYMREYPKAHLFLNGNMPYHVLSKYIKIAVKLKIEHTIINHMEHDSEIGLVLAVNYAIDKDTIYIPEKKFGQTQPKKGFWAKLFK